MVRSRPQLVQAMHVPKLLITDRQLKLLCGYNKLNWYKIKCLNCEYSGECIGIGVHEMTFDDLYCDCCLDTVDVLKSFLRYDLQCVAKFLYIFETLLRNTSLEGGCHFYLCPNYWCPTDGPIQTIVFLHQLPKLASVMPGVCDSAPKRWIRPTIFANGGFAPTDSKPPFARTVTMRWNRFGPKSRSQGSANFLSRGPKNEILLGGPQEKT